ncbi:AarF/ABC1/UbiB kinase family protein [Crassaminicella thermophila]|uniref:AarF/ABC1/UbiB kinase family protein n=1 Tax=Crassaminicella thermophila TaxID=2599308 RepID=A0A5C0SF45_CRATE|nr:AarF/ABC1/UbiB kinase family protein [Crassaminicella thermophila]QEK13255.1 AarF/ABC1/UbiB kinase family protein [Crassaminicella thermophila]
MKLKRKYKLLKFLFNIMKENTNNKEKLFEILASMKGIPQKYGQFLYLKDQRKYKAFEKLLDEGTPHISSRLYEKALKLTNHEINLYKNPIASASIGQVYAGTLKDTEVIVKIQYPKVKEELEHDWKFLKRMINLLFGFFRFPEESKHFLVDYLNEFEKTVEKETNYSTEMDNALTFQNIFKAYPFIKIPKVYDKYTKENLLVEEKCLGIPLNEFLKNASEEDKRVVLEHILFFYFHSFFNHQVLHGDPHSGNFFVKKENQNIILEVIDYGCVKYFEKSFVDNFKTLIFRLRNEDYKELYANLIQLGFKKDDIAAYGNAFIPILNILFEPFLVDEAFDFKYWKLTYKLNTLMGSKVFEKTISLPKDLLLVFRVFHGFISHVYTLNDPSFNVYKFV